MINRTRPRDPRGVSAWYSYIGSNGRVRLSFQISLLRVSHQFSEEVADILYSKNCFVFEHRDSRYTSDPFKVFTYKVPTSYRSLITDVSLKAKYYERRRWYWVWTHNLQPARAFLGLPNLRRLTVAMGYRKFKRYDESIDTLDDYTHLDHPFLRAEVITLMLRVHALHGPMAFQVIRDEEVAQS